MTLKAVTDGLSILPGFVNMYLLDASDGGIALIDTGLPKSEGKVVEGLRALGRSPADLKHIIATHAHPDHIGSLGALQAMSGARTYMHALDAPIAEAGTGFRPLKDSGLLPSLVFPLIVRRDTTVPPAKIDQHITEGDVLSIGGGIQVVHAPGHCAGQVALLWLPKRVLFTADVCTNLFGLTQPLGYENRSEGERSQRRLAALTFDIACCGHGKPLVGEASKRFKEKWST